MTLAPIALTCGDPAGIGPEITAAAWRNLHAKGHAADSSPPFVWIGSPALLAAIAPDIPLQRMQPGDPAPPAAEALGVIPLDLPAPVTPGRPDPRNAPATVAAIAKAVGMVQASQASAVVTNPIAKAILRRGADFPWPGHTEYLAHLAGVPASVMMLACPELRVVPATIHIPLAEVPRQLTPERLEFVIRTTHDALVTQFGLTAPRIALAGLNPHAGEDGLMGREELDWIVPLAERLRAEGLALAGPLPADTMFHPAARKGYDAAVAMYHDQALIPIKTIDFAGGVNVTLGLPFIRCSPDHGTAFDIAGSGRADPTSLIAALRMAWHMADARARARAGARAGGGSGGGGSNGRLPQGADQASLGTGTETRRKPGG